MTQEDNPTSEHQRLTSMLSSAGLSSFEHHEQLGSTNDRSLELIRAGTLDTPALILTDQQVSGRGQRTKTWWSSGDSLTFSWCWQPVSSNDGGQPKLDSITQQHGLIPLAAAVCVVDAITQTLPQLAATTSIKWPNDIMIGQHKVAGILVESTGAGDKKTFVIGIGINVNQSSETVKRLATQLAQSTLGSQLFDFPPTSLRASLPSGSPIDRDAVLSSTILRLNELLVISPITGAELLCLAKSKLCFLKQKISLQATNNEVFTGIVVGLAEDGGLMLDIERHESLPNGLSPVSSRSSVTSESEIRTFHSGSLRLPATHPPIH